MCIFYRVDVRGYVHGYVRGYVRGYARGYVRGYVRGNVRVVMCVVMCAVMCAVRIMSTPLSNFGEKRRKCWQVNPNPPRGTRRSTS